MDDKLSIQAVGESNAALEAMTKQGASENDFEIFQKEEGAVDFRTVHWISACVIFLKSMCSISFSSAARLNLQSSLRLEYCRSHQPCTPWAPCQVLSVSLLGLPSMDTLPSYRVTFEILTQNAILSQTWLSLWVGALYESLSAHSSW